MPTLSLVLLAALLLASGAARKQNVVVIYPVPDGMPRSPDFTARVRAPNGEWRPLFVHPVKVDKHTMSDASLATFDFAGRVEVEVTKASGHVGSVGIRPVSYAVKRRVSGRRIAFTLDQPRSLSVEVDGDRLHNLHIFANALEASVPSDGDPSVIRFGPGIHDLPGGELRVPSGKTVYLAGGAVVRGTLVCDHVENVRILGRGFLDFRRLVPADGHGGGPQGIRIAHSRNIEVDGITLLDPIHYTVLIGQSRGVTIRNLKSFSCTEWSDGIDAMSSSNIAIDNVFLRTSDDCIALYGMRWDFHGDTRHVRVTNSTLWADKAHPTLIGTHGLPDGQDTIEDIEFRNIDILEHHETSSGYHGCLAINAGDSVLVRNVRYESIRIEPFTQGQLINLRVFRNQDFNTTPGHGIRDIRFRNVSYSGPGTPKSVIQGYSADRAIEGVSFEHVTINGQQASSPAEAGIEVGAFVRGVQFGSRHTHTTTHPHSLTGSQE